MRGWERGEVASFFLRDLFDDDEPVVDFFSRDFFTEELVCEVVWFEVGVGGSGGGVRIGVPELDGGWSSMIWTSLSDSVSISTTERSSVSITVTPPCEPVFEAFEGGAE